MYSEFDVREILHSQLGGQLKVPTEFGEIDLLTNDKIIDIKEFKDYKKALGHILVYSEKYPTHQKCVYLFNVKLGTNIEKIKEVYTKYEIELIIFNHITKSMSKRKKNRRHPSRIIAIGECEHEHERNHPQRNFGPPPQFPKGFRPPMNRNPMNNPFNNGPPGFGRMPGFCPGGYPLSDNNDINPQRIFPPPNIAMGQPVNPEIHSMDGDSSDE